MPIVTLDGGQSSAALGGQVISYVEQLVAMQVPGAPDTLISAQLQLVLREFYTRSTGWRSYVGPYNVSTNPLIYLNPVDQNSYIQFVLQAYLFPYEHSDSAQPLRPYPRMPVGGTPQPPSGYYMQAPDQLLLYPIPDRSYGEILFVYASLVPTATSVMLPNYAYTQHVDGLQYGTMARLFEMKKRPWSDKEAAERYRKMFRMEILMARDIANRGYGPADTSFKFPRFGPIGMSQILPRATG